MGLVLTENLTQLLLTLGFMTLLFWVWGLKTRFLIISGTIFALSALVRPTYQAVALALAMCLFVVPSLSSRKPVEYSRIILAGATLISISIFFSGGYALSNYQKFGYFGISHGNLGLSLR